MKERQREWCVFVKLNGVEVEQMGLDGEGVFAKGRAIADVGDCVERFAVDGEGGDVDADGRNQFSVRCEVDGGHGVSGAVAAARGGRAVDGEGAAEKGAGATDIALGDELADEAGGDGEAVRRARSVDGDAEAELAA